MDDQFTSRAEDEAGGAAAGFAVDERATPGRDPVPGTVPARLVSEFASLTTPYCWVVTEDPVAGYDGDRPSAVGKAGPPEAGPADICEALATGRFFRVVAEGCRVTAIGRMYDPSGDSARAPLSDLDADGLGRTEIEYRSDGQWQAF